MVLTVNVTLDSRQLAGVISLNEWKNPSDKKTQPTLLWPIRKNVYTVNKLQQKKNFFYKINLCRVKNNICSYCVIVFSEIRHTFDAVRQFVTLLLSMAHVDIT